MIRFCRDLAAPRAICAANAQNFSSLAPVTQVGSCGKAGLSGRTGRSALPSQGRGNVDHRRGCGIRQLIDINGENRDPIVMRPVAGRRRTAVAGGAEIGLAPDGALRRLASPAMAAIAIFGMARKLRKR